MDRFEIVCRLIWHRVFCGIASGSDFISQNRLKMWNEFISVEFIGFGRKFFGGGWKCMALAVQHVSFCTMYRV